METIKKEKTFDAVKMMREIRDKISYETQNMTFQDLKAYMQKKIKISNKRLPEQNRNTRGPTKSSKNMKISSDYL